MAHLISLDDRSCQRIAPAQHLAGSVELAAANSLADAGAADHLTIEGHRRQPVHDEMQLNPQLAQQGNIAAPAMAERELAADAHTLQMAKVPRQGPDEFLAGLPAERFVESDEPRGIGAQTLNG